MTTFREALGLAAEPSGPLRLNRQRLEAIREELGLGLPSLDSPTLDGVLDFADEKEEADALEWLAERERLGSPEAKQEARLIRKFLSRYLVGNDLVRAACVRRFRLPSCRDCWVGDDGRCVTDPCPHPVAVKERPAGSGSHRPELAGLFDDLDWEEQ